MHHTMHVLDAPDSIGSPCRLSLVTLILLHFESNNKFPRGPVNAGGSCALCNLHNRLLRHWTETIMIISEMTRTNMTKTNLATTVMTRISMTGKRMARTSMTRTNISRTNMSRTNMARALCCIFVFFQT